MRMDPRLRVSLNHHGLATALLLAVLVLTWFAYSPGLSGSIQFDDRHNLEALARVDDTPSALRFISSGHAGPLGRPIALASFVPEAHAWPNSPDVFLRTNILIHLLNGVLVAWLLYLLGLARNRPDKEVALVAVAAAGLWMLMPILASSSLFIIQRMATLSATFVLGGAIGYFYCRRGVAERPVVGLLGMTAALGIGASLAALTKENGALLFLFILAIEMTLLDRPKNVSITLWRGWIGAVLFIPATVLFLYLVVRFQYSDAVVLRRGFDGYERLLTQAHVLWHYLFTAFLPNAQSLVPIYDNYPIQRSLLNPPTLIAVGAWIVIVLAAAYFRHTAPLLTFAVCWYLFGHALESTTIPLEQYFQHRNYLPLIGPIYALIASIPLLAVRWRRLAVFGSTAYASLLAVVLFSTTSLWGYPLLAAEMWHIYRPDSTRIVQSLGTQLVRTEGPWATHRVFGRFVESNPEADHLRLFMLDLSCQLNPDADLRDKVEYLEARLTESSFNLAYQLGLRNLSEQVRSGRCKSLVAGDVYRLGQSLLQNPRFTAPVVRHNIHVILAFLSLDNNDIYRADHHLRSALESHFNSEILTLALAVSQALGEPGSNDELSQEFNRERLPVLSQLIRLLLRQRTNS